MAANTGVRTGDINNLPLLFQEGDFIIATPQNVVAIIEVKSKVCKSKFGEIVEKANANGEIICSQLERGIFNGIFAYETGTAGIDKYAQKLEELDYSQIIGNPTPQRRCNPESYFCVNHMVLGNKFFYPIAEGKEVRLRCKAKMAKKLPD